LSAPAPPSPWPRAILAPVREDLGLGAWVELEAGFVRAGEADALLAALQAELTWEQREIVLFGRRILQPRLIAWGGELPYRYSGQTLPPRPFTGALAELVQRIAAHEGVPFNHVLANRYRDGRDSMGFHADDEPELGPDPQVATLSLGATRHLLVVPRKKRDGEKRRYALRAGDLFVMGGTCQRHFHHGIPREPKVPAERISLTLRHILRPPS
jgi:alkylated DNA repair dioxygenase AlkB